MSLIEERSEESLESDTNIIILCDLLDVESNSGLDKRNGGTMSQSSMWQTSILGHPAIIPPAILAKKVMARIDVVTVSFVTSVQPLLVLLARFRYV